MEDWFKWRAKWVSCSVAWRTWLSLHTLWGCPPSPPTTWPGPAAPYPPGNSFLSFHSTRSTFFYPNLQISNGSCLVINRIGTRFECRSGKRPGLVNSVFFSCNYPRCNVSCKGGPLCNVQQHTRRSSYEVEIWFNESRNVLRCRPATSFKSSSSGFLTMA